LFAAAAKVREDEGAPAVRSAYNVADYASGADDAAILAGNDDGPGVWNRSRPIRPGDHFLSLMPYEPVPHEEIMLPDRVYNAEYEREILPPELYVPSKY
jgi:hypothetical protein